MVNYQNYITVTKTATLIKMATLNGKLSKLYYCQQTKCLVCQSMNKYLLIVNMNYVNQANVLRSAIAILVYKKVFAYGFIIFVHL
jgi:hypothetical protein